MTAGTGDTIERFDRFVARCGEHSASERMDTLIRQLVLHYQHRRYYHTLDHINECLDRLEWWCSRADREVDRCAVELALWYHDCIYEPGATDNEERSAQEGACVARILGWSEQRAAFVAALIRATDHGDRSGTGPSPGHRPQEPAELAVALIRDIDLSILGAPAGRYQEYARGIRREYAQVPDHSYRAGRARLLAGLLERPSLYELSEFRDEYEQRARANLAAEIAALSRADAQ